MEAIIAINRLGFIGLNGGLPWPRHKGDMVHFRRITDGKIMLAGSKTYKALAGKLVLGNREMLRFSHKPQWNVYGAAEAVCTDELLMRQFDKPVIVIGGAQTYLALAPYITTWHVSELDNFFVGDTHFGTLEEICQLAVSHGADVQAYHFLPRR